MNPDEIDRRNREAAQRIIDEAPDVLALIDRHLEPWYKKLWRVVRKLLRL